MTTRTTSKTVTFLRPFTLDGFERPLAPGSYVVETEEELMDTLLSQAWKRVSTVLRVRVASRTQDVPIDPNRLDEALLRDVAGTTAM
jgi:hypothetical protein